MGIDGAIIAAKKPAKPSLKACPACTKDVSINAVSCPHCGEPLKILATQSTSLPKENSHQLLAWVGVALLSAGVFCPTVQLPIVGPVNYFDNGRGDGVALLLLAAISLALIVFRQPRLLIYTGAGSLIFLAYNIYDLSKGINEITAKTSRQLAGNPFRGIVDATLSSAQLQWGWAVLFIGAGLLIAAGLVSPKHK